MASYHKINTICSFFVGRTGPINVRKVGEQMEYMEEDFLYINDGEDEYQPDNKRYLNMTLTLYSYTCGQKCQFHVKRERPRIYGLWVRSTSEKRRRLDSGERATGENVERTSHTTVSFACQNEYESDFHCARVSRPICAAAAKLSFEWRFAVR